MTRIITTYLVVRTSSRLIKMYTMHDLSCFLLKEFLTKMFDIRHTPTSFPSARAPSFHSPILKRIKTTSTRPFPQPRPADFGQVCKSLGT